MLHGDLIVYWMSSRSWVHISSVDDEKQRRHITHGHVKRCVVFKHKKLPHHPLDLSSITGLHSIASFHTSYPLFSATPIQNFMLRFVFLLFAMVASAYGFRSPFVRSLSCRSLRMMSETVEKEKFIENETVELIREEPKYESLAISGFISKKQDFAEPYVFSQLFSTGKWSAITTITDDIKFARKRFVNPTTVYSGMIDVLDFQECDQTENSLETVLANKEAWIAYDVSSAQLPMYANVAAKLKMKRAIFAVKTDASERGEGMSHMNDSQFNSCKDIISHLTSTHICSIV